MEYFHTKLRPASAIQRDVIIHIEHAHGHESILLLFIVLIIRLFAVFSKAYTTKKQCVRIVFASYVLYNLRIDERQGGMTMASVLEKARTFLYRNARPLDLARFQYHFEGGNRENVLTALAAYQNADGGFGHALEADAWNPNSSPIQTWCATELLREVGCTDENHPLICGILAYLASGADFDGNGWANTIKSNDDYPHAPWWSCCGESSCHTSDNPTACLAGFIVRYAEPESKLHQMGCNIVREAYARLMAIDSKYDMHTVTCYIRMVEYCRRAGIIDVAAAESKLREVVAADITRDTSAWPVSYVCKPSQFFSDMDSAYFPDNREIAAYECEYIACTQAEDGAWPVTWSWSSYPEEWAVSKKWWQGGIAVKNLLYLKGMGRL